MATGDFVPEDELGWVDTNPSADPTSTDGVWWRLRRRLTTRRTGEMFYRHEVPTPYIAELGDRSLNRRGEWASGRNYARGDTVGISEENTVNVPGDGGSTTTVVFSTVSQHLCLAAHTSGESNHPVTGARREGVWVLIFDPLRVGASTTPGDDSTVETNNDGRIAPLYSVTYDDLGSGVEAGDPTDMPGEYTLLLVSGINNLDYDILSTNWREIVNMLNSVALYRSDAGDVNRAVYYDHVQGQLSARAVNILLRWADDMWIQGEVLTMRRNARGDRFHFLFRRTGHRSPASADASTVIPNTVSVGFDLSAPPPSVTTPTEPRNLTGTRSRTVTFNSGLNRFDIALAWDTPSSDGGAPLLRYEVRYRTRDPRSEAIVRPYPDNWSRLGTIESTTRAWTLRVSEFFLRDYQFQVRAVSVGGEGALAESQWFIE